MPAQNVKLTAELNTTLADHMLEQAIKNLNDRPRIISKVADFADEWEHSVFASSGGVTGRAWKPLAVSTVAMKGSDRPLVRSGALMAAVLGKPKTLSASVQIKAPEYAAFLVSGRYYKTDPKPGGNMPRRNPSPKPSSERLGGLMAELLDGVLATRS